jgi:hypothetical protein
MFNHSAAPIYSAARRSPLLIELAALDQQREQAASGGRCSKLSARRA